MKKTILLLLSSILLITIVLSSCNLDGTTGILWGVANSKAPLSIQYKQLLGKSGTDFYFRTAKGVERVDGSLTNTPVVMSSRGKLIRAASLAGDEVLYTINNIAESNKYYVANTDLSDPTSNIVAITPFTVTNLSITNLYANSMALVSGLNATDKKVYELLGYVKPNFTNSIAQFTMPDHTYGIENVIQQTGKEQNATAPMIVSFVNGDGDRIHYLVEPSGPTPTTTSLGTEDVQIANFVYNGTHMYVLSTDGKIYHVTGTAWSLIGTSSKTYGPNAFALAVVDGSNYHLITQPSSKTSALHVFTFPTALPDTSVGAGVDVKSGYAKEIALATIASVHVKSPLPAGTTTLLVATDENGMFDISITNNVAYKDIDANGSSSNAENYTF